MKGYSMILEPSKFWSTIKKSSIWAIEQVCTIKIVGSTTHFVFLGTQVPWSPGTQAGYLSFQWSKWSGEKNLRKNLVFWPTFVFWSISSDTQVPWSPGHQEHGWAVSASSGLDNFIRHTGPMVTRHTGGLSPTQWSNELAKAMCLVGKVWFGFDSNKIWLIKFGLCGYYLVIW